MSDDKVLNRALTGTENLVLVLAFISGLTGMIFLVLSGHSSSNGWTVTGGAFEYAGFIALALDIILWALLGLFFSRR